MDILLMATGSREVALPCLSGMTDSLNRVNSENWAVVPERRFDKL